MEPSAASLAASVVRTIEVDRTPGSSQRQSEIMQAQLAEASEVLHYMKKTDASSNLNKDRIRREREQKRRDLERHSFQQNAKNNDDDNCLFDTVA